MEVHARLVRIALLAHLRAAGWVPWLVLALWIAAAAAGEPLLLRGFGIQLLDQAAWAGGAAVAAIVLLSGRSLPVRSAVARVTTSLALLSLVAIAQGSACVLAEVVLGKTQVASLRAWSSASFFWIWAPTATALATNASGIMQHTARHCLTATCLAVSCVAAVAAWRSEGTDWMLGPGLCAVACALVLVASRTEGSMMRRRPCG